MITLYQLHWSHYVEKVRWALDFKGLKWTGVDIDPFTKRQMHHLQVRTKLDSGDELQTVPAIHDPSTGAMVGESSAILAYLEGAYPERALYPARCAQQEEVSRWMLWLDSTLGLGARRLAYMQLALEHPGYLGELFVPHIVKAGTARSLKARLAGTIIAGVLARRFRFFHNRADRVFESVERCVLLAARRLRGNAFLVTDRFTAADLTLASLMRPLMLVPYFRDHPGLQRLFDWRATQLQAHGREPQLGYEAAMEDVRRHRGWAYGAPEWMPAPGEGELCDLSAVPDVEGVRNDQQAVGRWPMVRGPLWYLSLKRTCGLHRTRYPGLRA